VEFQFQSLGTSLKGNQDFSFRNRNKGQPKETMNATHLYLCGILVKELFSTALAVDLDPYLGFYRQPRYGGSYGRQVAERIEFLGAHSEENWREEKVIIE